MILDHPKARALTMLDPFSAEYRARKGDDVYVAERDEASGSTGWRTTHHPLPGYGRACALVLEPAEPDELAASAPSRVSKATLEAAAAFAPEPHSIPSAEALAQQLRRELTAMQGSTSWRMTGWLRAFRRLRLRLIASRSRRS